MCDDQLLTEENVRLAAKVEKLENDCARTRRKLYWERWWMSLSIFLVTCAVLLLIGYPLYKAITVDAQPTHCEIIRSSAHCTFGLYGHIPWRSDTEYGHFATMEEAMQAAKNLKCEVRSQR